MAAAKTATQTDPLARREELWAQLDHAHERADANDLALRRSKAELEIAHRDLAEARIADVRGDKDAAGRIAKLRAEVERLDAEVAQAVADGTPIGEAMRRIGGEVEKLHDVERDAFVADAQAYADEAAAALEALREPYTAAYDAWSRAQSRWAPFVRDLDDVSAAPSWPWASPVELFEANATERRSGRIAARVPVPHELRDAPAEPTPDPPGTVHVWERADGYQLTTTLDGNDDTQDRLLDAEPDWRLVGVRPPA
jgi:hypothetical protein